MKRYIRASISPDTPEWLRHDLARDFGKDLSRNYRIALDKVRFLDEDPKNGNSLVIYNIPTSYGSFAYAPGVNDSKECAIELASLLRGVNCYVNLIPYNEVITNSYHASSHEECEEFFLELNKRGINATLRMALLHFVGKAISVFEYLTFEFGKNDVEVCFHIVGRSDRTNDVSGKADRDFHDFRFILR